MKRLIYSDQALQDFDSILDLISLRNPRAAVELGSGLLETCKLLEINPELGVRKGKLGSTLRMFTHRKYAIYYRNLSDRIRVTRFLHPSLDASKQDLG